MEDFQLMIVSLQFITVFHSCLIEKLVLPLTSNRTELKHELHECNIFFKVDQSCYSAKVKVLLMYQYQSFVGVPGNLIE